MATRYFALLFGLFYALVGVLGFIPGITTPPPAGAPELAVETSHGLLFGIFPVNLLHNLVHIVVGIAGVLAFASFGAARAYALIVAIVFAVLTVMGLIPGLSTAFGLVPLHGNNVWLHALTTILAAVFAFVPQRAGVPEGRPCPGPEPC